MPDASLDSLDQFPELLARLPPDLDVAALGRETGAFCRARGVRSAVDLLRLALAWGPGGYFLQQIAAWASKQGLADVTDEALVQRLHKAAPLMEAITGASLQRAVDRASWSGRVLRISDSSGLSGRASRGTDWRIHGVYDLGHGGFTHLQLTDGRGAEALDRGAPVSGEIRIADRGYANAPAWRRYSQAGADQADYIVRLRWNTVRLFKPSGDRFDLIGWLGGLPEETQTHCVTLQVQADKHQPLMPVRLVVWRKPADAKEAAHKRLRQQASRKPHRLDERTLTAAEFVILATSLSEAAYAADEILAVYRLRWQIELAFKRLKSLLRIDKIRTRTDAGTRCWLHAHLIVALLCEDLSQDLLESFPSGSRRSRTKRISVADLPDRARHPHRRHPAANHTARPLSGAGTLACQAGQPKTGIHPFWWTVEGLG